MGAWIEIELFELDNSGIHVAKFITELPSKEIFENKLKQAIETAKSKLISRELK